MGINNFTEVFEAIEQDVQLGSLAGKKIAIDAFSEMYRMALGVKHQGVLTDKNGQSTAHLNGLVAFLIKLHRNGIKQTWVFDYIGNAPAATPEKAMEIQKRKQAKLKAALEQNKLFIDESDVNEINGVDASNVEATMNIEDSKRDIESLSDEKKEKYYKLEKRTWKPSQNIINDFILVLDCFCIPYIVAPPGFEGECICSMLAINGTVDAVYSGDTDPIAFGAPILLRYESHKKQINMYTQANILSQLSAKINKVATLEDIRKTAVILGCDFADKTPGAGPKRFPNYFESPLTEDQKKGIIAYGRLPETEVKVFNSGCEQFKDDKREELFKWLTTERGFSADRIRKCWFNQIDKPAAKTKKRTTVAKPKPAKKPRKKAVSKTTPLNAEVEAPVVDASDDGVQPDFSEDYPENPEDIIGIEEPAQKNKPVFVSPDEEELDL